jgi:multidrug efflux pump subunit AcrA (membrane-fusion protein)
MPSIWLKRPFILPIMALSGVAALVIGAQLKQPPQQDSHQRPGVAAHVMVAHAAPIIPRVVGHGVVHPTVQLSLVAEVAGRIVWRHPQLDHGALLDAGTELLRLDATDYQLAARQAQANIASANAQIAQLEINASSLQHSQTLMEQRLASTRKELLRKQALLQQGALPQSQLDAEQRAVLQAEQELVSLQQQLAILPAQRDVLLAQQQIASSQAQQQQRNIDRTTLVLPVAARIANTAPEVGQFAAVGQPLIEAQGIDSVDIEARFTLSQLRPFMQTLARQAENHPEPLAAGTDPASVSTPASVPASTPTTQAINRLITLGQLSAQVELPILDDSGTPQVWQGQVVTFREGIDPQTRTLAILVRIPKPYRDVVPGQRPPLITGLNARVTLQAHEVEAIAIPSTAIHAFSNEQGSDNSTVVYLLDDQQRLQVQAVTPLMSMANQTLLAADALPPHSQVILSDVVPAVAGTLITPVATGSAEGH